VVLMLLWRWTVVTIIVQNEKSNTTRVYYR
jgi:hypothetical protein